MLNALTIKEAIALTFYIEMGLLITLSVAIIIVGFKLYRVLVRINAKNELVIEVYKNNKKVAEIEATINE